MRFTLGGEDERSTTTRDVSMENESVSFLTQTFSRIYDEILSSVDGGARRITFCAICEPSIKKQYEAKIMHAKKCPSLSYLAKVLDLCFIHSESEIL